MDKWGEPLASGLHVREGVTYYVILHGRGSPALNEVRLLLLLILIDATCGRKVSFIATSGRDLANPDHGKASMKAQEVSWAGNMDVRWFPFDSGRRLS